MFGHSFFLILTAILSAFGRAISEVGAVMIVGGNIDHFTRVMNEQESFKKSKFNQENSEIKKDDQSNTKDDKVDLAEKEKIEAKSFAAK